jgi:hypothetical protein
MYLNLADVVSLSYFVGIFNAVKSYDVEPTSSPREGVLRIVIALKNGSSSVGFEPASLRSNGKHVNHYTTESDIQTYITYSCEKRGYIIQD